MTREKYRARLIKRQAMLEKERRAATERLTKARDDVDSVNIALRNCVQDLIKFDRETLATMKASQARATIMPTTSVANPKAKESDNGDR